jgi:NADPH-dependent 2,4-dienoyl-CoA reductase/sulfur reductase-like enzyme
MFEKRICYRVWLVVPICSFNYIEAKVNIEEKDLVIIGGGVAGYVAAIKAGQEGMKV